MMDVCTLQKVSKETIRILVWVLSFMTFGNAMAEYEITLERLGVYRPEEHIELSYTHCVLTLQMLRLLLFPFNSATRKATLIMRM